LGLLAQSAVVILIMTTALCAKGQGLPKFKKGPLAQSAVGIIKITRPKQKKKKKLEQFSGSKPSGLSPQRALFKFREALHN
jgi:hypothetical protein